MEVKTMNTDYNTPKVEIVEIKVPDIIMESNPGIELPDIELT